MSHDIVQDSDAPNTEPESLARRRKRTLVARAANGLKRRLVAYRTLAAVAVIALVTLGAYTVTNDSPDEDDAPQAVLLGTGKAGIEDPSVDPSADLELDPASEVAVEGDHIADGSASFYGDELAGNPTASGETFDPAKLTAAHRTLPLGSRVRVTNLRNGESVVVRINDRGPFHGRRIIDLSKAAAKQIDMLRQGTARVRIELLSRS